MATTTASSMTEITTSFEQHHQLISDSTTSSLQSSFIVNPPIAADPTINMTSTQKRMTDTKAAAAAINASTVSVNTHDGGVAPISTDITTMPSPEAALVASMIPPAQPEETQRKLQLSLDELIEQSAVITDKHHHQYMRGQPHHGYSAGVSRSGGRRHNTSEGGGGGLTQLGPVVVRDGTYMVPNPPRNRIYWENMPHPSLFGGSGAFMPPELGTRRGVFRRAHMLRRAQPYDPAVLQMQRQLVSPLVAAVHVPIGPDISAGNNRLKRAAVAAAGMAGVVSHSIAAADSALSDIEIIIPPSSEEASSADALIVRFKNTDVLRVRKARGEMILNSGGWRTLSTRLVLNSALKPLGLWVETDSATKPITTNDDEPMTSAGDSTTDSPPIKKLGSIMESNWTIVDGSSFLQAFQDGMSIGQVGSMGRCHLQARASVIAQYLKQVKNNAMMRRRTQNRA